MPTRPVNLAIVGATGLAGRAALELLPEAELDPSELKLLASERSKEERLEYDGEELPVAPISAAAFRGVDLAIFLTPPAASREWVPRARAEGCAVVDASGAFAGDPEVPLLGPTVEAEGAGQVLAGRSLVAVVGGAAAALAPVLAALSREVAVEEVVGTVLVPASGAGRKGLSQLEREASDLMNGREPDPGEVVAHRLAYNAVPQVGIFLPDGRTDEEAAVEIALRRLLSRPALRAALTAVRVPVFYGLTAVVRVSLSRALEAEAARALLRTGRGVKLLDVPGERIYPMPMLTANDEAVLVGRVRADAAVPALDLVAALDDVRALAAAALRAAELLAGEDRLN